MKKTLVTAALSIFLVCIHNPILAEGNNPGNLFAAPSSNTTANVDNLSTTMPTLQQGTTNPSAQFMGGGTLGGGSGTISNDATSVTDSLGNRTNTGKSIAGTKSYSKSNFSHQFSSAAGSGSASGGAVGVSGVDTFQQDVFVRTGKQLRLYGYNLLGGKAFSTTKNQLPSNNYVLGPGDQISIRGWGAVSINLRRTIDPEGGIFIPKVGRVQLAGIRVANLDKYLKKKLGRSYRNFSISATVTKLRSIQIVIAGLVASPGTITVSALSTLTDAIFSSGAPLPAGSLRNIELKRNGKIIKHYDMYDLLLNGNNSGDIRLAPGDVIYVPHHYPRVAIYNGVEIPAIYETKPGETIADIVKFAGGVTNSNLEKRVVIESMDSQKLIHVSNISYQQGMKQKVDKDEIVHFFTAANQYTNSVMLIGNVAHPARFAWHSGMKITDIIPNKSALLTKSFWNSYNLNTYAKDAQLSSSGREKTADMASQMKTVEYSGGLSAAQNKAQYHQENVFSSGDNLFVAGPLSIPETDINWNYAVIIRLNPNNYQTKLIPFNLAKALRHDPKNDLLLKPGDIINVLSSKDILSPSRQGVLYVMIDGEVNHPGVFELPPKSTLKDALKKAQGVTSDAYLYGLLLSRNSVKQQQKASLDAMLNQAQQALLSQAADSAAEVTNGWKGSSNNSNVVMSQQKALLDQLRKLKPTGRVILSLNPSSSKTVNELPNVPLENGDVIHIPAVPSTISVVGQVYNPGTFIFHKHFDVQDYIDLAGTTNDFADDSRIYIMHADGTVYSKQQAGWFGSFSMRDINPGDAIIVPQSVQFMTGIQTLLNWTQILSNFGFGAAALAVFR